ncbi:MAG: peptide chain release factor 1 [Desulfarculaceae bacterium]|jgi:peptide chain release factor 1
MALNQGLIAKLEELKARHQELEQGMADPKVLADNEAYQKMAKEHADLSQLVAAFSEYNSTLAQLEDNRQLLEDDDSELAQLAQAEVEEDQQRLDELEQQLNLLLLPKDPNDDKNVFLEIRAGTGGEEAALFAADLLRMYLRFGERRGWKTEIMSEHPTNTGGFKEVVVLITGKGAYSQLKYESGVHRVQRVPVTESQGRIHTSAVTVAVLPEAEDVELEIKSEELRIDVFRASGPGGQHVNKTESAVRITHLPTGLVVSCQDEKSQHKNKAKAMKVLRARLFDLMVQEQQQDQAAARKSQVGSGDRSERIRTYNFPQGRVTDHRIGLTLYKLDEIMQGQVDPIIEELTTYYQTQALQNASA